MSYITHNNVCVYIYKCVCIYTNVCMCVCVVYIYIYTTHTYIHVCKIASDGENKFMPSYSTVLAYNIIIY